MRKTVTLASILVACISASCLGQAPVSTTRVGGRVINQAGQPLSNATVALVGNNRTAVSPLPPAYTTTSSSTGAFVFETVEPNTYRLFAQHAGYLEFVFSQPDGKVVIPVADGEQKTIEVKMTAQSFLSGKVTDEVGQPFPAATVTAYRLTRVGARKQLNALPAVVAGRDGSFSVPNIMAGRYYIAAAVPPSLTQTNQREVSGGSGDEKYVSTYYPSAIDTSTATPIEVPSGTELRDLEIRLRRARVFHILGKIANQSGGPVSNANINLLYPQVNDPLGNQHRVTTVDGAFQINGLLPGDYVLQGSAGAARELKGRLRITLLDHDADNIVLTVAPGADIPLSVRIEDADRQQAESIRKLLGRFTLTSSTLGNENAMAQAKEDGTWLFHNIGAGTYRMGLGGPDGTYIKSIRFGPVDITHSELDTSSGEAPLEMVLSPHAADISGAVLDAHGQALPGVDVTLWIPGLPPPGTLDQAKSTRTDAMGQFKFRNLGPGEYRLAAWEKIDAGVGNLSEFHIQFDGIATAVKLSEESHRIAQPVLIGSDRIEAAVAKLP